MSGYVCSKLSCVVLSALRTGAIYLNLHSLVMVWILASTLQAIQAAFT